ncbi:MAG: bifunctional glutamate N-acetyltransferase/amino-acid acetyltransferase ArgJ [Verrucomicrobiota bacterium]
MKKLFTPITNGSVTSPQGYFASGVISGIKKEKAKDVALILSEVPAEVAATYTTNQVKAAPVRVSMQHSKAGRVLGIIANSGNANACTGVVGLKNAMQMTETAASVLNAKAKEFLVCSTGRIGINLPMTKVVAGIKKAVKALKRDGGLDAAHAIMTSDSKHKSYAIEFEIDGKKVRIGGIAKGAGMIHPNMATMLSFVTTDAVIDKKSLQRVTEDAVEMTFNRISVDGDTSTNDTVIVLANGKAGNAPIRAHHPSRELFRTALTHVMKVLSRMIVEDGEGISKVVDVSVKGAASAADAKAAAQAISTSALVKCSWCGGDPNWGRIMDAIGYSDAKVKEELVEIYFDGLLAVSNGRATKIPVKRLKKVMSKRNFTITVQLHLGAGEYSMVTTDFTEKYVEFNKGE